MIVKSAEFVTSAVKESQYPDSKMEIAFAGRSNVGKSSLINTLVNRKRLVKTSSTPGRTQLINFFKINDSFFFVDLPGFGYAKVPKKIQKNWGIMVETYLTKREALKGLVLLVDIRREPRTEEFNFINWMEHHNLPYALVLTKCDKFSKNKCKKQADKIAKSFAIPPDELIMFSIKTRIGNDRLWNKIEDFLS